MELRNGSNPKNGVWPPKGTAEGKAFGGYRCSEMQRSDLIKRTGKNSVLEAGRRCRRDLICGRNGETDSVSQNPN